MPTLGSTIQLLDCEISNMGGGAFTVQGQSTTPAPAWHPVTVQINGLVAHTPPTMWNKRYCHLGKCATLGFYPLTFVDQSLPIPNRIELSRVTLHADQPTFNANVSVQVFAGCTGGMYRWTPMQCYPGNLTGLEGDVTVLASDPRVCSKSELGIAGSALEVTCSKATEPG
jgi:hypothetical protein